MKGVKVIRTSDWDTMVTFYCKQLGMRERDHAHKDSLRELVDFGTEIHLERVSTPAEHEVLGSLELYSINPDGLASHLRQRGMTVDTRTVGGQTELLLSDPDGHILSIVAESHKA
jgi:catechol 2,3-dioxygenase-like lactoylglutathione lyase family enzyme